MSNDTPTNKNYYDVDVYGSFVSTQRVLATSEEQAKQIARKEVIDSSDIIPFNLIPGKMVLRAIDNEQKNKESNWIFTPDSKTIEAFSYNNIWMILTVVFKNGDIYNYYDVNIGNFELLLKSPNPGHFVSCHIKGRHYYARIDEYEHKDEYFKSLLSEFYSNREKYFKESNL